MSDKQYRCSDAPECGRSYCQFYGKYFKTKDHTEKYFSRRYCTVVGRDVHSVLADEPKMMICPMIAEVKRLRRDLAASRNTAMILECQRDEVNRQRSHRKEDADSWRRISIRYLEQRDELRADLDHEYESRKVLEARYSELCDELDPALLRARQAETERDELRHHSEQAREEATREIDRLKSLIRKLYRFVVTATIVSSADYAGDWGRLLNDIIDVLGFPPDGDEVTG